MPARTPGDASDRRQRPGQTRPADATRARPEAQPANHGKPPETETKPETEPRHTPNTAPGKPAGDRSDAPHGAPGQRRATQQQRCGRWGRGVATGRWRGGMVAGVGVDRRVRRGTVVCDSSRKVRCAMRLGSGSALFGAILQWVRGGCASRPYWATRASLPPRFTPTWGRNGWSRWWGGCECSISF